MISTMKNYNWKKLNNLKRISAVLLSVVLLAGQFVISPIAQAADPQFNMYTPYVHSLTAGRDYYLLDVKNETKNTDWNFPVAADAGDTLTFYLYYHNGVNGTIATNTTLKVSLPTSQNTFQTVSGYLWADNAANATFNNPINQSVQVNLSSSQTLQYISGSAKWYPNQADWRTASATPFPGGQNENQLFSSGINLGSIEGCWEFSGTIIFKVRVGNVQPVLTRDLLISKTVRNITAGQNNFSENATAANNDRLMWQIQINNTGTAVLNNVMVRDTLPSYLSYVTGTTRVDGSYVSDGLTSGSINLGSIAVNASKTVTFESTVNSSGLSNNQTLTNYAYALADQVNEKNDSATAYLSQSGSGSLTINKTVSSITAGQGGYFESVNAANNDHLSFQIRLQNTGTAVLNNVMVRDTLPSYLSYVTGTTRVDGSYVSDGLTSGSINTGSLSVGGVRNITFEATVNSSGTYGNQTLTNYAYGRADQISEISDSALVYISQSSGFLNIYKYVRNLTANQSPLTSSTNANAGDRLLFSIQLTTPSGSGQVNNIRVWDALPSGLTYSAGTVRVDGAYYSDALFSGGINLGTMSSNLTKNITFEATVNSLFSGYLGTQTFTNYAYVAADNIPQQSASAQVSVGQSSVLSPTATLTKKVANLTSPNGTDNDNNALLGDTLQYTITFYNNGPGVLNTIHVMDVLPPYTTFQAADNGGSYDSSANQVAWTNGNLANSTGLSFTYRVTVQAVPNNGYVIRNTASADASNLAAISSNEVRTTVTTGVVKGAAVRAITGGDNFSRNLAVSVMTSLWFLFFLYLIVEYADFWRGLRFKLAVWKIKRKENL